MPRALVQKKKLTMSIPHVVMVSEWLLSLNLNMLVTYQMLRNLFFLRFFISILRNVCFTKFGYVWFCSGKVRIIEMLRFSQNSKLFFVKVRRTGTDKLFLWSLPKLSNTTDINLVEVLKAWEFMTSRNNFFTLLYFARLFFFSYFFKVKYFSCFTIVPNSRLFKGRTIKQPQAGLNSKSLNMQGRILNPLCHTDTIRFRSTQFLLLMLWTSNSSKFSLQYITFLFDLFSCFVLVLFG